MPHPSLDPAQLAIVKTILRAQLPESAKIWIFGSRANGRPKQYSDLDLAIDTGRPLTLDESTALAEDFTESDLPWKVDVVDLATVADYFRRIIESGPRLLVDLD